jgi:hypothetical protein
MVTVAVGTRPVRPAGLGVERPDVEPEGGVEATVVQSPVATGSPELFEELAKAVELEREGVVAVLVVAVVVKT